MPVCSYLVFPRPGATKAAAHDLSTLPGCSIARAENRDDLMVLVTETGDDDVEAELQESLAQIEAIQCLVLTFGEVDREPV